MARTAQGGEVTAQRQASAVVLPTGAALAEYDGFCLDLVDELLHTHPQGMILYVECAHSEAGRRRGWRYHAAMVLDGLVYDAWYPSVRRSPADYVKHVFGDWAWWQLFKNSDSNDDLYQDLP
jgi:hypothetical protein